MTRKPRRARTPALGSKAVADPAASASELSLRERKKARLRRQIAEIALDLYRERGHASTTVDEICRRAEISQPTFYNYYPSKEAILTEHALRGFGDLLRRTLQEPGSLQTRLQRYFAAIAAQMTRDRKLWHAIAVSNAYNPVRDPSLLGALQAGTRVLEQALAHGQEHGEITRSFSAQRLASMLEGIMLRVGIEWGAGFPDQRALADSMAEALEFFLRGARAAGLRSAPDDH
jgi:AcrR family transcriptional regulator